MPRLVPSTSPQVLVVDAHLLVAHYCNVPTAACANDIQVAVDTCAELRGGYELLVVVSSGETRVGTMPAEDRRAFGALMRNPISRAAYLVLLTGFAGVTVRSALAAMSLFGSNRRAEKAFGVADEATHWLGQHEPERVAVIKAALDLALATHAATTRT